MKFTLIRLFTLMVCVGSLLVACAGPIGYGENPCTQEVVDGYTPAQLGRLGARLLNRPQNNEAILREADLTPRQIEQAIRIMSSDPALSRCYRRAFEKAL